MYAAVAGLRQLLRRISRCTRTASARRWPRLHRPATHRYQTRRVEELHAALVAHGDPAKHIWITEIGWSTCCAHSECVSDADPGARLPRRCFRLRQHPLARHTSTPSSPTSSATTPDARDVHGGAYGIVRRNGARKPSWYALDAARARAQEP